MEMNDVIQAISTVGFPIVCCGVMFWQNYRIQMIHKEESEQFSKAIENNTTAIQRLTFLLENEVRNND